MNWKERLGKNRKIKVGDMVKFKSSRSSNAHYFRKGLENLEVHKLGDRTLTLFESDKSNIWGVIRDEVELQ